MKNILLTGATGMVGSLVLDYALNSPDVEKVTSLIRRATGHNHPKLNEVIISDFKDYTTQASLFKNIDAAYFCIGAYTGQVSDDLFKEITLDYAVAFAEAIKQHSPSATLCLLSGAGADRTEKSRVSFAKYKGMAENQIAAMNLGAFHVFRPAYIYPVAPRKEPNLMYSVSRALYPLIRLFGKNASIKSTELASAMFRVGLSGAKQEILENRDILEHV
ncbi:MAG: NAD-dependent epimerase/dehydratase family protein, partial [Bacteroidota bacterium]